MSYFQFEGELMFMYLDVRENKGFKKVKKKGL